MMSTSTLLFLIVSSQFLFSVQGLTLRLKGQEIIPNDGSGEVDINDLPVGGCRRYETLECLSDVKYRGREENAHWWYTDPNTLKDIRVDDINCKSAGNCKNPNIGWHSIRGIYKKGSRYYSVVRLGRNATDAAEGVFICEFKGDSNSPVSVKMMCKPPDINEDAKVDINEYGTISWNNIFTGHVTQYKLYYAYLNDGGLCYYNELCPSMTSYTPNLKLDKEVINVAVEARTKCNMCLSESTSDFEYINGTITPLDRPIMNKDQCLNATIPNMKCTC